MFKSLLSTNVSKEEEKIIIIIIMKKVSTTHHHHHYTADAAVLLVTTQQTHHKQQTTNNKQQHIQFINMDALFRFILLLTISLTTPNDAFVFPTRNFCNYGNDILISHRQRSSSSTNNVSIHRTNDLSSSYCTYASIGLSSLYKLSLSSSLHEDARATNNNQTDSKPESMNLIKEQVLQPDSSSKITSIKATKEEHNIEELSSSSSTSSSSYDTTTIQSIVLLNFVAVIWGTQHSFIKIVVDDCDTSAFSFTRFALAALIATVGPSLFGNSIDTNGSNDQMNKTDLVVEAKNHEENQVAWRWGLEMGLWMFLGYAFQAIGLEVRTFTTCTGTSVWIVL